MDGMQQGWLLVLEHLVGSINELDTDSIETRRPRAVVPRMQQGAYGFLDPVGQSITTFTHLQTILEAILSELSNRGQYNFLKLGPQLPCD